MPSIRCASRNALASATSAIANRPIQFEAFLRIVDHQLHAIVGHGAIGTEQLPGGIVGCRRIFALRSVPSRPRYQSASWRLSRTKRLALMKALITWATSCGFSLSFLLLVPRPICGNLKKSLARASTLRPNLARLRVRRRSDDRGIDQTFFERGEARASEPKAISLLSFRGRSRNVPTSSARRHRWNCRNTPMPTVLPLRAFNCVDLRPRDERVGRAVDQHGDDFERNAAHGGANDRGEDHRIVASRRRSAPTSPRWRSCG